jgi:hypothetical protein
MIAGQVKDLKQEHGRGKDDLGLLDCYQLKSGALFATGSFIIGGLLTQDKWAALNSGLSGLDGALQGFGRARWVVSLGKRIVVTASEGTPLEGKWLAWESLKLALEELRNKALFGEALGNLDDVLYRLEHKSERRFIPVNMPIQPKSER